MTMDAAEVEALEYFINEADCSKNLEIEEEHLVVNEADNAADFLQKVGLSDLTKHYYQGNEISENVVNDSVRAKHLTERQAQTVRSRVKTLNNNTLHNRQARRKRQDIRDITWNVETSSTGTRSRSATPDSLDSVENLKSDTSDEEGLINFSDKFQSSREIHKPKIKWTSSEPIKSKRISRSDKGSVAHSGSENVILKGYQPLKEYPSLPRRKSDHEVHLESLKTEYSNNNTELLSTSPLSSTVYITQEEEQKESLSFESLFKQNKQAANQRNCGQVTCSVNIDELSDIEYQFLKPLLYVELVAIFDQYKIVFLKRKAASKLKGGNVFGVNLSTLIMRDMPSVNDNFMAPKIFEMVAKRLNERVREDGILRLAGQKQKLEFLYGEIEATFFSGPGKIDELLGQATVHELTGVLKKLLRDLPDPIFTMELFDMFYKTNLITSNEDQLKALNLLVLLLPIEHRNTFKLLLTFFLNVVEHEKENRMNLHNVAMITAPSLFPPRLLLPKDNNNRFKQLTKDELSKQVNDAAVCCCLMEKMLTSGLQLYQIPTFLADQAREAQKRAQDKKDLNKEKTNRYAKPKLVRSSTQYKPDQMNSSRIKRDLLI